MPKREILAFTPTYGDRARLTELVDEVRGTAGRWFDWMLCQGAPSERASEEAKVLLKREDRTGFQYVLQWKENRGQHHAFKEALKLARERNYTWILRIDDDVKVRTKLWLDKMVTRLDELQERTGDGYHRLIAGPRIIGLRNPIHAIGQIDQGQKFPVEVVSILGGVCRLHPVELLKEFIPDVYLPLGRGDPQSLVNYVGADKGILVRFPDIRLIHKTDEIERDESPEYGWQRRASHYWPYLGEDV